MKLDHKLKGKLCLWQEIVFLFLLCSILLSQLAIDPASQAEWKRDSLLLEGPSVMGKRSILLTCGLLIAKGMYPRSIKNHILGNCKLEVILCLSYLPFQWNKMLLFSFFLSRATVLFSCMMLNCCIFPV